VYPDDDKHPIYYKKAKKETSDPTEAPTSEPTQEPTQEPTLKKKPKFRKDKCKYCNKYRPCASPYACYETDKKGKCFKGTQLCDYDDNKHPIYYKKAKKPTTSPTDAPTQEPTNEPTSEPTISPTMSPSIEPPRAPQQNYGCRYCSQSLPCGTLWGACYPLNNFGTCPFYANYCRVGIKKDDDDKYDDAFKRPKPTTVAPTSSPSKTPTKKPIQPRVQTPALPTKEETCQHCTHQNWPCATATSCYRKINGDCPFRTVDCSPDITNVVASNRAFDTVIEVVPAPTPDTLSPTQSPNVEQYQRFSGFTDNLFG